MERRRPRHPHPEASQGGVRKAAVAYRAGAPQSAIRDNCLHQSGDRPVQRFIRATRLVDLINGVPHRIVMPAAELAADLL